MAGLRTSDLLAEFTLACDDSSLVEAYTVHSFDLDILSVRVCLVDGSFVDVFYNTASGKTAFAHIADGTRVYGQDNARVGWHVHPHQDPGAHRPCDPVTFSEFLAEVEHRRG